METLGISKKEYFEALSDINTLYHSKYKDKQNIAHISFDFIYKAENHGFNNYLFYDKVLNDNNIKEDWNNGSN